MRTVWSKRDEETFGGESKRAAAHAAKYKYQKKEMELQVERTALTRLNAALREKKEEHARLQRTLEKHQLEGVRLEDQERFLRRALDDVERKMTDQKSQISRIEHDVERLREEAFRGSGSGV